MYGAKNQNFLRKFKNNNWLASAPLEKKQTTLPSQIGTT